LGVDRILTSGQADSAEKGMDLLKQLNEKAKKRIAILPGGGINAQNAKLFKDHGFIEIHASASSTISVNEKPKISMNSPKFFDETIEMVSDLGKIKEILNSVS
jgi:copper homeostasis protein